MNFLVENYVDKYNATKRGVYYQLLQFFTAEQLDERRVRENPLLEEIYVLIEDKEVVIAEISVEEIKPLIYTVVGRIDKINLEALRGRVDED